MNLKKTKAKKAILLGMHRSGTSATAGWMHNMGISMGEHMLGSNINNQKGHFEDLSLLNFHIEIAKNEGIHNWKVYSKIELLDRQTFNHQAKNLISNRDQINQQWGWKEPRMVLYLDYWKPLLKEASYIILYRHYSEVAASLVSREIRNFLSKIKIDPSKKTLRFLQSVFNKRSHNYIKLWKHYNRELLAFYDQNVEFSAVFDFDQIRQNEDSFMDYLSDQGFNIEGNKGFFDVSLISKRNTQLFDKEAESIYKELRKRSYQLINN